MYSKAVSVSILNRHCYVLQENAAADMKAPNITRSKAEITKC